MTSYTQDAIRATIQHQAALIAERHEEATAYREGMNASDAGLSEHDTPYVVGTRPWFAWIKGWMAREVAHAA